MRDSVTYLFAPRRMRSYVIVCNRKRGIGAVVSRPSEVRDNVSITRNSMYVEDDEDRTTCDVPDIAYS